MSLIIYTPDYSGVHEITNAISVQMSYYYNDIGKLILDFPITDENVAILKNNSIVYDTKKKLAYIIKNVKTDTSQNRITANGFTTNQILNSRVRNVWEAFGKNTESAVYALVNKTLNQAGRGLQVTTAASKGLTETYTAWGDDPYLLGSIMPVLESAGLGHRMNWNHSTKQHTFEVYKGNDLTTGLHAVVFSDEQGTARDLVITDDITEFYNVAYVTGYYTDEEGAEHKIDRISGNADGINRYEIFIDGPSPEDGDTYSSYEAYLYRYGLSELAKMARKLTFSVSVDPSEIGVLYNVGDIVACVSKRFGVRFNARISGVKYRKDSKSETTEIILGEPVLTTIGEVNLIGEY